jgi:hypothetical protein
MNEPTHEVRASLLDKRRLYRLGDDALHWQDAEREGQLAYADIVQVRLINYPSIGGNNGQCTVSDRSGKKLKIRSHHYESLGSFEDRSETYVPFVRALSLRVASAAPNARLVEGSTVMWVVWLVLLLLVGLTAVLLLLAVLEGITLAGGAIGALVALVIFAPSVWRMVRQGRTRSPRGNGNQNDDKL